MSDYELDYEEAPVLQETPSDDDLSALSVLVSKLDLVEQQRAELADSDKKLKADEATLRNVKIPQAMQALGLSEIKMANGAKVEIISGIHAAVTKANQPKAFEWLRSTGNDDIIKNEIKVRFGPGEDEKAAQLQKLIREEYGVDYDQKASIHPGTLKVFCREEVANGTDIPFDVFGIYESKVAKITKPS